MKILGLHWLEKQIRKSDMRFFDNVLVARKTRLLLQQPLVKLHLGCGRNLIDGWINIDKGSYFKNRKSLDLVCDLTRGVPFPDSSVDYIYHEHLIEHLCRPDGLLFSKECFRVLKPGGRMRIAYPDLDMLISAYQHNYSESAWYFEIYPERKALSTSEIFNLDMREFGEHRHIYNKSDMLKLMAEAGFRESDVSVHRPFESGIAVFQNVEKRHSSVCVEAVKSVSLT